MWHSMHMTTLSVLLYPHHHKEDSGFAWLVFKIQLLCISFYKKLVGNWLLYMLPTLILSFKMCKLILSLSYMARAYETSPALSCLLAHRLA